MNNGTKVLQYLEDLERVGWKLGVEVVSEAGAVVAILPPYWAEDRTYRTAVQGAGFTPGQGAAAIIVSDALTYATLDTLESYFLRRALQVRYLLDGAGYFDQLDQIALDQGHAQLVDPGLIALKLIAEQYEEVGSD